MSDTAERPPSDRVGTALATRAVQALYLVLLILFLARLFNVGGMHAYHLENVLSAGDGPALVALTRTRVREFLDRHVRGATPVYAGQSGATR